MLNNRVVKLDFDPTKVDPLTGKVFGKPGSRIKNRIQSRDPMYLESKEAQSLFYAYVAEAPSCWPRVLDGTMTQERFSERIYRMKKAIDQYLSDPSKQFDFLI